MKKVKVLAKKNLGLRLNLSAEQYLMLRVNLLPKQHLLLKVNMYQKHRKQMLKMMVLDVPFESEYVPETQKDNEKNKEESDYEDEVEESQEDNDEDGADDDEKGVHDTQVRVRKGKPSKWITENMLKKIMVDKKGIGMNPEKPLTLD
ncbi:unnamed protein product [Lactuca saligna]|uniref:Uncharacterized protein n=1 Tax=Lactuca saligna TaxID=75948 RepID=A0AA36EGU7_LACSI|nr:unnamed protein product [Lactuca saligna]